MPPSTPDPVTAAQTSLQEVLRALAHTLETAAGEDELLPRLGELEASVEAIPDYPDGSIADKVSSIDGKLADVDFALLIAQHEARAMSLQAEHAHQQAYYQAKAEAFLLIPP